MPAVGPTALMVPHASENGSPFPSPLANDQPSPASPSARPKDVVDSYLRQLYGGPPATRCLAARGLGALPSFLPRARRPLALRLALELGAVAALADCLAADEERSVQEACLVALSSLLLATAPAEEHAAPLRPPHLKQLGALLMRREVLEQIGFVLSSTSSGRVVLAAARVVAITAPYLTQINDLHLLDSRIIPALLAAAAHRPAGASSSSSSSPSSSSPSTSRSSTPGPGPATQLRDAAACALALLALCETTPGVYAATRGSGLYQSLAVLYGRVVAPGGPTGAVLPADVAALLLRAATLAPLPRWGGAGALPRGHARTLERHLEESDALECLVSYVAVEAANLRALCAAAAAAAAANAAAVLERNRAELEQLSGRLQSLQRQLAEAGELEAEAQREAAQADAAADAAHLALESTAAAVRNNGGQPGGSQDQRRVRREAEAVAAAREAAARGAAAAVARAAGVAAGLREEAGGLRRAMGPLRWQAERMAALEAGLQRWLEQHAPRGDPRVRLSRPNLPMLQQVLAFLLDKARPASAPERGAADSAAPPSPSAPSPAHTAAVHGKLLAGGLVQAAVRLASSLSAARGLASDLASLLSELALAADMGGALEAAGGALGREAGALEGVARRTRMRLTQVEGERAKLVKALKLGFPRAAGAGTAPGGHSGPASPHGPHSARPGPPAGPVALGPANGLSREVARADVERRLAALDVEAEELVAVVADAEGLGAVLGARLQDVTGAAQSLQDSQAHFLRAFPSLATPATPAKAPAPSSASPSASASPARSMRLASGHILAKDAAHPAGHLLATLSRSLSPLLHAATNLAALARQIQGRPPPGAAAATCWLAAVAAGSGGDEAAAAGVAAALGGLSAQPSLASLASSSPRSRPASALAVSRSASALGGAAPGGGSSPRGGRLASAGGGRPPGYGVYGAGAGSSGYGGGYGGFGGLVGSGPFPVDGMGRPMRFTPESMYGIVQATHSPMRGYSAPNNGPRFALLLRDKHASSSPKRAGPAAAGLSAQPSALSSSSSLAAFPFSASPAAGGLYAGLSPVPEGAPAAAGGLSVAEESRRLVAQAASSVLFDPVDVSRASSGGGASLPYGGGAAYGSGGGYASECGSGATTPRGLSGGGGLPESEASDGSPERGRAGSPGGVGGEGGEVVCVLDALLQQSELLCGVMAALAALQAHARSGLRAARLLPALLSYESVAPGAGAGSGAALAPLHGLWAEALPRQPGLRVPIARAVEHIAALGVVPPDAYGPVYGGSGIVHALVRMLEGGLRPPGQARGEGEAAEEEEEGEDGSASSPGSPGAGPARPRPASPGPAVGRPGSPGPARGRAVGRLGAGAPPTLRLGPAQQAEQAAAARALIALSGAQPEALAALGREPQLLARLCALSLDNSMSWPARAAAADLLADCVLGGGGAAAAAVGAGAYAALAAALGRDMYPFYNQDPRSGRASVVSALAAIAGHEDLLEGVVRAAAAPAGPSAGLPLDSTDRVLGAVLRALWGVCAQASPVRNGTGGKHVDPELITALTSTAATAAHELAVLADTNPTARGMMHNELLLVKKISTTFLQAVKEPALYEALLELRKNLT